MFGRIIDIKDKILYVENLKKVALTNYIGYHIIFDGAKKIVGEITFVTASDFQVKLLGEILNGNFIPGIDVYPLSNTPIRLIYKNELELIIGSQEVYAPKTLLFGKSSIYDGYYNTCSLNDFFSNHFAIIGNTGSGKSCGVSRLIQNIFSENKKNPTNSHIIIFDVYGEYKSAFSTINSHPGINIKCLCSDGNLTSDNDEIIKIPLYLLEADDLALLLNITDPQLITTLEKTLTYVYIFKSEDKLCEKYKNDIIAKVFLDILSSGKPAQQIRDQSLAFLSKYNTENLNLETIIPQMGYNRTIRQCLNIDPQGKLLAVELLMENLKKYSEVSIEKISVRPTEYNLDDLYNALEFALISDGSVNNTSVYEKLSILKTSLHSLITSENRKFFDYNGYVSRETFVKNLFTSSNDENVQIVDVNFNGIDDRLAKTLCKLFAKILYKFSTTIEDRGTFPINMIIEEAHRYVQSDNDINVIGYNIFDRIAKEGRKYGILIGLITQRLAELSSTVLSQCSNFIVFRLYYPEDIQMISNISSNVTFEAIERVKSLRPGSALLFGTAFKVPMITRFEIPNPMPTSTSVDITGRWYNDN